MRPALLALLALLLPAAALHLSRHPLHQAPLPADLTAQLQKTLNGLSNLNNSVGFALGSSSADQQQRINSLRAALVDSRNQLLSIYSSSIVHLNATTYYCPAMDTLTKQNIANTLASIDNNLAAIGQATQNQTNGTLAAFPQQAAALSTLLGQDLNQPGQLTATTPVKVNQPNLVSDNWVLGNANLNDISKIYASTPTQYPDMCPLSTPYLNSQGLCISCPAYYDLSTKSCFSCDKFDPITHTCLSNTTPNGGTTNATSGTANTGGSTTTNGTSTNGTTSPTNGGTTTTNGSTNGTTTTNGSTNTNGTTTNGTTNGTTNTNGTTTNGSTTNGSTGETANTSTTNGSTPINGTTNANTNGSTSGTTTNGSSPTAANTTNTNGSTTNGSTAANTTNGNTSGTNTSTNITPPTNTTNTNNNIPPPNNTTNNTTTPQNATVAPALRVSNLGNTTSLLLPSNTTLPQYIASLQSNPQNANLLPCPSITPFFDGTACIACPPSQYFSPSIRTCQTCPSQEIYNPSTYHCEPVKYYSNPANLSWVSVGTPPATIKENNSQTAALPNGKSCPLSAPFFNGSSCMACSEPKPLFSYDSLGCTACSSPSLFDPNIQSCITPLKRQTNPSTAPNLIFEGRSLNEWKYYYVNNVNADPSLEDCPAAQPHFDGYVCLLCPADKPYFNLQFKACQKCSDGNEYDAAVKECLSTSGNIVTQEPTLAKMAAGIFA